MSAALEVHEITSGRPARGDQALVEPAHRSRPARPAARPGTARTTGRFTSPSTLVRAGRAPVRCLPPVSDRVQASLDPHGSRVQLTRRGWLVLLGAAALFAASLLWVGHVTLSHEPVAPRAALSGSVVVGPGDTLWSIATSAAPQRDPRAVVDELRHRNHLASVTVVAGQVLRLS